MSKILSSVTISAHPVVEMQISIPSIDEVGAITECVVVNKELRYGVETSFLLDVNLAKQIIAQMQEFIDYAEKQQNKFAQ